MAREARVVLEAVPYHIIQRGNNRQDVFLLDEDRRFYIETLRVKAREHGLTILGWCLMTEPRPSGRYPAASRLARESHRAGALAPHDAVQPPLRTQRPPLAGPLLLLPSRADASGQRAGLRRPESGPRRPDRLAAQYPWSSAAAHGLNAASDLLIEDWAWSELKLAADWAERLEVEMAGVRNAALRRATFSGLPLGDALFVEEMEGRLQGRLRPKPVGRPPKERAPEAKWAKA